MARKLTCSTCGYVVPHKVWGGDPQFCPRCRVPLNGMPKGKTIEGNFDDQYVMWQYEEAGKPVNSFPIASRLSVREGMTALLPIGKSAVSVRHEPSPRSLQEILGDAVEISGEQITLGIFFVRDQFKKAVRFGGEPKPIENAAGDIAFELRVAGKADIHIANAELFAKFVGYETHTENWLIEEGDDPGTSSKQRDKLRSALFLSTVQAVQELVKGNGWTDRQIELHTPEIQDASCQRANQELEKLGLIVENINLLNCRLTVDLNKKTHDANWRIVLLGTEMPKAWESPEMLLHNSSRAVDPDKSGRKTYKGTFSLSLADKNKYMISCSQVEEWIENGADQDTVYRFWAAKVNEQLKNEMNELLQNYIEYRKVDIDEVQNDPWLRREIGNHLNDGILAEYGLRIKEFVMELKN